MFKSAAVRAIAALGLTASVLAAPVELGRRDVSQDLFDQLNLFEQYSAAAYCSANNEASAGTAISCSAGNCPLVQQAGATILYSFNNIGSGDVTGFLALDSTNQLIVLSFRGSETLENWIADLEADLVDASAICSGCEAHDGFLSSWNSVASTLTSKISSAVNEHPSYKLVFTGHSLGAALATLGAVSLRESGYNIDLYNYGCPRVGNTALADFITTQSGGTNYRVTHSDDPVPKLPPRSFGYSQPSPEYWITSGNNVTVQPSDIEVIEGVDSTAGNDGTPAGLDIDAHRWYFGPISACS
ncbi:hypothetical protein VTN96DRAFT_9232 [Rasamsonia emersonii]|uniref:Lipase n=1 Tax=Rasamsonia emersonii (strain ATCC 16479 / CBS 393.64 / IMI 116815) TaxID=1408163 RepID=A0A0F4YFS6_RASE3|nr:lipase [Rasamsonia emersonii CBS 393.64]KKA16965.1 lipase [Rasamsonia emersonii CBS 393.64]UBF19070.1 ReLip [synthetic construct]